MNPCVDVIGVLEGFRVSFLPFFRVTLESNPVILLVATVLFCTFTVTFFCSPLASVIVSVAVPVVLPAVMTPLLVTVKIFVLLDFQDFTESPFARPLTFRVLVFCFTFSGSVAAFTLMVAFSFLPLVLVSFFLQMLQVRASFFGANTVASDAFFQLPNLWPVAGMLSVLVPLQFLQV